MLMPMQPQTRADLLAVAFKAACEVDMRALKPGNVGDHGNGHGMRAADFRASAAVAARPLAAPEATVGERIFGAIAATRSVVTCNTNLGIVLLCAPLAHAALGVKRGGSLRREVKRTLTHLDVGDARRAYAAIRLARPGGLGHSARHDVAAEPTVGLLAAMREAKTRDAIARQYALGYWDIFEFGVPLLRQCSARRATSAEWTEAWSAVAVYLDYLAYQPDSHVVRKHGAELARAVSEQARDFSAALRRCAHPRRLIGQLLEWDHALKQQRINPGTSADLTVATLLALRIEDLLAEEFTRAEQHEGSRGKPMWETAHDFSEPHL